MPPHVLAMGTIDWKSMQSIGAVPDVVFLLRIGVCLSASSGIVAFVSAHLNLAHEYGVAVLLVVALCFFTASLVNLARDTRISLHEMGEYR
jgi:hypothetical protein